MVENTKISNGWYISLSHWCCQGIPFLYHTQTTWCNDRRSVWNSTAVLWGSAHEFVIVGNYTSVFISGHENGLIKANSKTLVLYFILSRKNPLITLTIHCSMTNHKHLSHILFWELEFLQIKSPGTFSSFLYLKNFLSLYWWPLQIWVYIWIWPGMNLNLIIHVTDKVCIFVIKCLGSQFPCLHSDRYCSQHLGTPELFLVFDSS